MKNFENQNLNELLKDSIASIVHEAVSEAVDKIIKEKLENSSNKTIIGEEEYLKLREAAEFTKLKVNTIYDYVKKRFIPHIKVNRTLIFNKSELIDWLKSKRVRTRQECEEIIKTGQNPLK